VINCVFEDVKRGEMLIQLLFQINNTGTVVLILPTRCLLGKQIRSILNFQEFLEILGFSLLEPPHQTPHLSFFVMGRCAELNDMLEFPQQLEAKKKQPNNNKEDNTKNWRSIYSRYCQEKMNPAFRQKWFLSSQNHELDPFEFNILLPNIE
jgi:hypothetical protein